MKTPQAAIRLLALLGTVATMLGSEPAAAHGERAQEPFLRMRTIQWYDLKWSPATIGVNEETTLSGKFHLAEDWPRAVAPPDRVFLNVGTPSPVFLRTHSYLNDVPFFISGPLEIGRDYAFKVVLKGRLPGRYHVHPLVSVEKAGPIAGPGSYVDVVGSAEDFTNPMTTLTGQTLDTNSFGLANGLFWHGLWIAIAVVWLLYFLSRPLFLHRYRALLAPEGEAFLLDPTDRKVAAGVLGVTLALIAGGYFYTEDRFPYTVPIQSGETKVEPLPVAPNPIKAEVLRAEYDVPGRSLRIDLRVSNAGREAVRIGEFTTAGLRFVNEIGRAYLDPAYPEELVAGSGLKLADQSPIAPGEVRVLRLAATDANWERQRLVSLLNDPESRFGGLVFTFDDTGRRHINSIAGPVIPLFTKL